ncbi:MAG: NAD-dependent epimerase/dehydratase family protein [Labilithrix sp.]|nr:NAD-dependent epimerase/dehydratase family protein [Labilithrix sp.]
MSNKVLITGGAGFVGSHLADELLAHGHTVRALDNLAPRVHRNGERPSYLDPEVELIVGDVRDGALVEQALEGMDVVFHLAAAVGAGESVFEVDRCMSANNVGTAVLMDRLVRSSVERLILGSSMCVYGEGLYQDPSGSVTETARRRPEQLRRGEWEPTSNGEVLTPIATPESKTPSIEGSVYAGSKYDQERMCLRFGRAFGIPTMALRFFNVFGTRQSLSNPYSGDLARFASRLLAGRRPLLAEDGGQLRDFVDVREVASACRLAMTADTRHAVINVGSGRATSLFEMARRMAVVAGSPALGPEITGRFQIGDVRHCFADVSRATQALGHRAGGHLDAGLLELLDWVASQTKPTVGDTFPSYVQLELGLAS